MQSEKYNALFITLLQCLTIPICQTTSGYMALLFISIGRMPFLALTLDNADPLFVLVITPVFYMHEVEMADQDPACGSL